MHGYNHHGVSYNSGMHAQSCMNDWIKTGKVAINIVGIAKSIVDCSTLRNF